MQIVLDSNILFSALIRDSTTRKLILEYDGTFLFPTYIFEEAEKYKEDILRKSHMSKDEFNELLGMIMKSVTVVPSEILEPHRKEAFEIVKDIDVNDVLFVACALAYSGSIIWSNDSALKKQSKIKIVNTAEVMTIL